MEIEKRTVTDFIECYRRHPAIWDINRADYMKKDKKDKAYAELVQIYKRIKSDANEGDVKRKINCLRSCYRREKRKIELRGNSTDCENETTLYWFKQLKFMDHIFQRINKQEKKEETENSLFSEEVQIHYPPSKIQKLSPICDDSLSEIEITLSSDNRNAVDVNSPSTTETKQNDQFVSSNPEQCFDRIHHGKTILNNDGNEDDANIFGSAWTLQFRSLCEDQKIFAKKAIDDILFEAQMRTLHRNSIKINDSVCQYCQATLINRESYQTDTENDENSQ